MSAPVIADVVWNGLWQRMRVAAPSISVGVAMMLVVLGELVWNIAAPSPCGTGWTALLQNSSMTLPRVVVKPFRSELYVLLLLLCGCWTYLRHGGKVSQAGWAAVKISFLLAFQSCGGNPEESLGSGSAAAAGRPRPLYEVTDAIVGQWNRLEAATKFAQRRRWCPSYPSTISPPMAVLACLCKGI